MTRREFLEKTAKLLAAVVALILIAWTGFALVGVVLHPSQPLRPWEFEVKNTALAIGLGLLIVTALAAAPMAPGAVGGVVFGSRPRPAGAAAAVLAFVLWHLSVILLRPGDVPYMSWLGWVINLAWWGYFGSVGGAFAVAVRTGWREGGSRKSAPAP